MVVKFMQGRMRRAHVPQPWCWFIWACMQRDHLFSFYLFIYCRLFSPFLFCFFFVNFWLRYQWGSSDCCGGCAGRHWHGHQDPQVRLGEFQGWGNPSVPQPQEITEDLQLPSPLHNSEEVKNCNQLLFEQRSGKSPIYFQFQMIWGKYWWVFHKTNSSVC